MTAIEKMVEWLYSCNREMVSLGDIIDKANALAAEEKSKPAPVEAKAMPFREYFDSLPKKEQEAARKEFEAKTTAPASLVEELERYIDILSKSLDKTDHDRATELRVMVLSRYRPASSAVEELVDLKEWASEQQIFWRNISSADAGICNGYIMAMKDLIERLTEYAKGSK